MIGLELIIDGLRKWDFAPDRMLLRRSNFMIGYLTKSHS